MTPGGTDNSTRPMSSRDPFRILDTICAYWQSEALHAAIEQHRRRLWAICYRMTGRTSDADDLCQEAVARALDSAQDESITLTEASSPTTGHPVRGSMMWP